MNFLNTETEKEPKKESRELVVVEPELPASRIKSDPKLWAEAMEFANMLTYKRPHMSRTERLFITQYLTPLGVHYDTQGNAYKKIGENPTVLWSCHTDTVHGKKGYQKIVYWPDKKTGEIWFGVDQTNKGNKSSCMGADDTCGIWLMIQMIRANVPGLYIFHRAEEIGGKGSAWISEKNKEALAGIKFAIAFDRRDEKSIITFQRFKRCCSDEFAESLAEQLGMQHKKDTTGSFTDTANYTDLIGECTNVSVGYDNAHMSSESTNVDYLFRLRDALLKLDVTKLVEKRKAGTYESKSYSYSGDGHSYGTYYSGYGTPKYEEEHGISGYQISARYKHNKDPLGYLEDYEFRIEDGNWFPRKDKNSTKKDIIIQHGNHKTIRGKVTYTAMVKMIRLNPEVIADILEQYGYDGASLLDEMLDLNSQGQKILC